MKRISCILVLGLFSQLISKEYNIYIDADFSIYKESSYAIEMGIKTALDEQKKNFPDIKFNVIRLDHRANSRRSLSNMKKALKDPDRLVVFGGMHSPPILANKNFINDNKILLLVPWAAAGPISRAKDNQNWIFRLSVDDSKAGSFLVNAMVKNKHTKPFLLLEKTGWGKNNLITITKALQNNGITATGVEFFNWQPDEVNQRAKIRKIIHSKADCILFVGNSAEGQTFARRMNEMKVNTPVISHWGITGGDFFKGVGYDHLAKQEWQFLQTEFSFMDKMTPFQKAVLNRAEAQFPKLIKDQYIEAPVGFIHSYDLTKILLQAALESGINTKLNHSKLHYALENLKAPVSGLIKEYIKPFSPYSKDNIDAHEALNTNNYRMATFNKDGKIILK